MVKIEEKTIQFFDYIILIQEIIGISAMFKQQRQSGLYISFYFKIYTRQNCIEVNSDTFTIIGEADEPTKEKYQKFNGVYREVHDHITRILNA